MNDLERLERLNADDEPWMNRSLSDGVKAWASIVKGDFGEYVKLALAYQEVDYRWHPIHDVIINVVLYSERAGMKCVMVLPPGLGKSSILRNYPAWRLGQDPGLSIGFASFSEGTASENLIRCRKMLCSTLTKWMWPGLVPDMGKRTGGEGQWSMTRLYLKGRPNPACEANSVLSDVAGRRRDIYWFDDCITAECRDSEVTLKKIHDRIHNTHLTRLPPEGGFALFTNNCWARMDTINDFRNRAEDYNAMVLWVGYDWECTRMIWTIHNPSAEWLAEGYAVNGEFELWENQPQKALLERRADVASFKRIYMQQAAVAEESWLPHPGTWKTYEPKELPNVKDGAKCIAYLDPSGGQQLKGRAAYGVKKSRDRDYAAMVFGIKGADGTLYVVDIFCERVSPREQIAALWVAHKMSVKYGYPGLHRAEIEIMVKDEQWLSVKEWIEELKQEEVAGGRVIGRMPWGYDYAEKLKKKETRIGELDHPLSSGDIKFPAGFIEQARGTVELGTVKWSGRRRASWEIFLNQAEDFGSYLLDHDDALDALSGLWRLCAKVYAGQVRVNADDSLAEGVDKFREIQEMIRKRKLDKLPEKRWIDGEPVKKDTVGNAWGGWK